MKLLIPELAGIGLKVNLGKSSVYSTHPLAKKHMRWLKKNKLSINTRGGVYLGAPFGSEEHIRGHVRSEASRVCGMIDDLMELDTISRIEHAWADSQGLYALVRLSLNHLLRHYTRTMDPRLIEDEFACVDRDTL